MEKWRYRPISYDFFCVSAKLEWTSDLVKVDGHRRVAHLWRLMVGSSHGRKRHLCPSGADWYAQRRGDRSVRRRVRVAHHKTLPLQHDGLRVVLAEAESHAASQEEDQCQHGTESRAARGHHGRIADPVHTDTTRQPLGGLLVLDHLVQTYSLLFFSPLSLSLFLYLWCSLTLSNTLWHAQTLSGCDSPPSCAS